LEANISWKERLFRVKNIEELENLKVKAQKVKESPFCPFCDKTYIENKNRNKHIRGTCELVRNKQSSFAIAKTPASSQKELT
jgi:hypothetical protein